MNNFHISRIKAQNFRGFDSIDIALKKFSILAGCDSGRSDLLQAFFFLWYMKNEDFEDVMKRQDWRGSSLSGKNSTLSLEYHFKSDSPVRILKNYIPSHCTMTADTIIYKISICFSGKRHSIVKNEIVANFSLTDSKSKITSGTVTMGMNRVVIKPELDLAYKDIPGADLEHVPLLKNDVMTMFISPEWNRFLPEISVYDFACSKHLKSKSNKSERMLDHQGANLSGVLRHIGRNQEMKEMLYKRARILIPAFESISVSGKPGSIKFCLKMDGSKLVPADLVSDENTRILALLVCIILPRKFSVIESPERGISPETLQNLSQMMAEPPGCGQLVISTDSPEMLKHAKSGVVLAVFRDKNKRFCVSAADGRIKKLQKALETENAKKPVPEAKQHVTDIIVRMNKRPPKKTKSISIWSKKELPLTMDLRMGIYKEQEKTGNTRPFNGPVSVVLYVSASSILDVNELGYVGDLDSFIAGVCDAIQSAHTNVTKSNKKFQGPKEIGPDKPLLINNDSQITEIIARKTKSKFPGYTLIVHPLEDK